MYDVQEKSSSSFFNLPFPNSLGMFFFFCPQWLKKELLKATKVKLHILTLISPINFTSPLQVTIIFLSKVALSQVPPITLVVQW
jgi:hypothetical protein